MRRMISFLLLAATAAGPLAAQTWNPQDRRPPDDARGPRGDVRRDDPRADGGRDDPRLAQRDGRGDDRRFDDRRGPDARGPDVRGPDGRGPDGRGPDWRYDGRRDGDRRGDDRGRDWWDGRDGPRYGGNDRGRDWNGGRGGWNGGGGWNSGWRNDRRYDWQGYRSSNRALYRAPRYYGPRGYDYSRWSRGYRVEPFFYGRNYWINDPYRCRLPPAYGDYRWVRYYDDVALIDLRTGLIEDIIYSFFYR
ncbi:RcnB family protein [Sphingomonas profundi]|uniref:RcnB family protein n=1 Tax=Alterirhizorhabdus profundi TaxID=2681549 RepID=UPI0012E80290|nr:RcnB family protein [Sphingomonas profundi]